MAGSSRPLARTSRSWIYPVSRMEREEARDDSRITLAYHWTSSWRRETRPARWIEMTGIVGVFALLLLGWTDGCCLVCITEVGGSRRLIVLVTWLVEVLRWVGASDIFLYIVRNSVLPKISKRYWIWEWNDWKHRRVSFIASELSWIGGCVVLMDDRRKDRFVERVYEVLHRVGGRM